MNEYEQTMHEFQKYWAATKASRAYYMIQSINCFLLGEGVNSVAYYKKAVEAGPHRGDA